MLSKILGVIWMLFGAIWLVKPQILKNHMKKKMNRRMRGVVYGFILVFGFLLIGSVIKSPGFLSKVVGIVGAVIAIKAILLITSKTSEKIFDWEREKPLIYFRMWALAVLAVGLMLMFA